ncbi:hypothetical protein [Nocardia wallacei]|uniref:hypothetical protein n=1 Tax=Nocardia wallacei TaxID=480035 RepID=UPI002457E143|nr:hypothetical protein [Nocardia wallacei]
MFRPTPRRYGIGTRVRVSDLQAGDWFGEHEIYDMTSYEDHDTDPDDIISMEIASTTGGRFARPWHASVVVPHSHYAELVTDTPGEERLQFTCRAARGSRCRPVCADCGSVGDVCDCHAARTDSGVRQLTTQTGRATPNAVGHAYDGPTPPSLRSGPVHMYPTQAGRFLWRYPAPTCPATSTEE